MPPAYSGARHSVVFDRFLLDDDPVSREQGNEKRDKRLLGALPVRQTG